MGKILPVGAPAGWSTDEWATPPEYFALLNQEFGPFTLDACATAATAKVARYYDKAADGLRSPWFGRVFVNPPYSAPGPWCRRAAEATKVDAQLRVVMLLPAGIDTAWFHDWVLPFAEIRFIRGRIRFHAWDGKPGGMPKGGNLLALYPLGAW